MFLITENLIRWCNRFNVITPDISIVIYKPGQKFAFSNEPSEYFKKKCKKNVSRCYILSHS